MRWFYTGCILVFLVACQQKKDLKKANNHHPPEYASDAVKVKANKLLQVDMGTPRSRINLKEEHLHGKFFHEKAEFYVIENPEIYISDMRVEELTLYFIDNKLCKKKFRLSGDISSDLIKSYGGFKFLSLNSRTREIAKKEEILSRQNDAYILNDKLEKFQMKWIEGNRLIKYRLLKNIPLSTYTLEEELSEYEMIFTMVENGNG